MILKKINGKQFKELVTNGARNLGLHYQEVDSLNVFPVPDGDTGTNMLHTIEGGIEAIEGIQTKDFSETYETFSKGMLLGARGNSGVILSQIFRGICKDLSKKNETDVMEVVHAFKTGIKQAYGAVVTPVEGTILTVYREATDGAAKKITKESTINDFFELHLKLAQKSLKRTQEILPILKEAGVVDSGASGYVYIVEGIVKYLRGEVLEGKTNKTTTKGGAVDLNAFTRDSELEFGYCTEFILRLQTKKVDDIDKFDVDEILDVLHEKDIKGESIVALKDGDIVKVHVHTKEPGIVLHKMRKFGEFLTLKIENMALEHNEKVATEEAAAASNCQSTEEVKREHKKYAIVAVAQGKGIKEQFEALGVDYVVCGNQTMNPSTQDFIKAFNALDAENIIVFPNNKNIYMAAKQAAALYKDTNVEVLHSNSIPQCYSALTMMDLSVDDITLIMGNFREAIRNVISGEITIANRSTKLNGVSISKGDHLCIVDGKIVYSTKKKNEAIVKLLNQIPDIKDKAVLTIFYGKGLTEEEKNKNLKEIKDKYPNLEVGGINGGQAVYKYLIAIE